MPNSVCNPKQATVLLTLKSWHAVANTIFIGVSPSGKATVSESVMRWFKSNYPSQTWSTNKTRFVFFCSNTNFCALLIKT